PVRPVCDLGYHVLEVKYDEFLPEFLQVLINAADMRRTSFSKYCMARLVLRNY
ncbi:MAG: VTC domain-containing protein, partial [Lachnospiraceae bacterium]|nr:VTC domain-containing protein [Lachnospiraceae bacterium]